MGVCADRRVNWLRALSTLILAGISSLAAAGTARANVFDTDERRIIAPGDQLDFVGVIACENTRRLPTASLITPPADNPDRDFDLLLTVAHAFYTRQGERWVACAFRKGGDPSSETPIIDLIVGTTNPGDGWNDDWAVAKLGKRIASADPRPRPAIIRYEDLMAMREEGATILLAGHDGEQLPLLLSTNCGPRRKTSGHYNLQDNRVFNHDCDMMAGWSGGPLLLRDQDETKLIGINATEYNSVVHQQGWPYDGRFNPNTAIRINPDILKAIDTLASVNPSTATRSALHQCDEENNLTC